MLFTDSSELRRLFDVTTCAYDPDANNPCFDVTKDDDGFVLVAELPGIRKGDLDIKVAGTVLTVNAERTDSGHDRKYEKALRLPKNIDCQNIDAKMEDGLLTMTIPFKKIPPPIAIKIQ